MQHELTTTGEVIEALGGIDAVMSLTGAKRTAAFNWKYNERFPARTFLVISKALGEKGLHAPPSLWGMASNQQAAC